MKNDKSTPKGRKTTCPACGKRITYLISRENTIEEYVVWLDETDKMTYNKTDTYNSPTGITFYCPECGEELANARKKAKKILQE